MGLGLALLVEGSLELLAEGGVHGRHLLLGHEPQAAVGVALCALSDLAFDIVRKRLAWPTK